MKRSIISIFLLYALCSLPYAVIAQNKGNVLEDANGYPSVGVNIGGFLTGNGTSLYPINLDTTASAFTAKLMTKYGFDVGLEARDKHWFVADLTSNGNHTHEARYHTSTVNHVGSWAMNYGASAQSKTLQDSTAFAFYSPVITLGAGIGVNPRIVLDGGDDRIYFTTTAGDYRFENLTADDHSQYIVGADVNGRLFARNALVQQDEWISDATSALTIVPGSYVAVTMTASGAKTVTLPDATIYTVGTHYEIFNGSSSGDVTVVITGGSGDVIYGSVVLHVHESAVFRAAAPSDVWNNN